MNNPHQHVDCIKWAVITQQCQRLLYKTHLKFYDIGDGVCLRCDKQPTPSQLFLDGVSVYTRCTVLSAKFVFVCACLCYCCVTEHAATLNGRCRKPCGVSWFTSCACVLVIKAACDVRSCTAGAQTFIKPQQHHLPGVLGVPLAETCVYVCVCALSLKTLKSFKHLLTRPTNIKKKRKEKRKITLLNKLIQVLFPSDVSPLTITQPQRTQHRHGWKQKHMQYNLFPQSWLRTWSCSRDMSVWLRGKKTQMIVL